MAGRLGMQMPLRHIWRFRSISALTSGAPWPRGAPSPRTSLSLAHSRRHALAMTWDFGEANPFSESGGNFIGNLESAARCLDSSPATAAGCVRQLDAWEQQKRFRRATPRTHPTTTTSGTPTSPIFSMSGCEEACRRFIPSYSVRCSFRRSKNSWPRHFASTAADKTPKPSLKMALGEPLQRCDERKIRIPRLLSFTPSNNPSTDEDDDGGGAVTFHGMGNHAGRSDPRRLPSDSHMANAKRAVGRSISLGANALASSIVLACRPALSPHRLRPGRISSPRSRRNSPTPCGTCKKVTSPPSIWRRRPSVPAWRSSPVTRRFSKLTVRQCESEQHWR